MIKDGIDICKAFIHGLNRSKGMPNLTLSKHSRYHYLKILIIHYII